MNNHKRLSILMALTTMAIIGLSSFIAKSNAGTATTIPIGDPSFMQANGYDSNPTAGSTVGAPLGLVGTNLNARDGSLGTNVNWRIGGAATGTTVGIQVNTFENTPPAGQFTIGWLDIKVDYNVPTATVDDRYRVVYNVAPEALTVWHDLAPYSTAVFPAGFPTDAPRAFTHVPEPNDGVWTWTDVANLRVRVESQRVGATEDGAPLGRRVNVWEIWATVYQGTYPAPNTLSIQPPEISGLGVGGFFYIDLLATNLVQSHGFQVLITYNTQVLTAFEVFTYTPYLLQSPSEINDAQGYVALAYSSFLGDPNGFTGDNLLARIYFFVDWEGRSPIHFQDSILSDVFGIRLAHTTKDGLYRGPEYLSALGPLNMNNPIGSQWHEIFPHYSLLWTATGWIDNGDGFLSASDQLTLTNSTGWSFNYHVDVVTTTIHWTYKDTYPGALAAAETETPNPVPPENPLGTRWHQIYPPGNFSRTFTITSWIDNGDGVFSPSDQFDYEYDDNPGVPVNAHLDQITTDIIVSLKGDPQPPVPEFPLGIGLALALAPAIPIIYKIRTRAKRRVD